jgi:5-methylcytosine-specific restriction protein A
VTPRRPPYRFTEKGRCRWCGQEVRRPRRNWCSDACVAEYKAVQPDGLRAAAHKRDRGVCQLCGRDCDALARRIQERLDGAYQDDRRLQRRAVRWRRLLQRLGLPVADFQLRRSLWDADHRVALAEGGPNELANIRTACIPCHREETAKLRRRLLRASVRGEDPRQGALALEAAR